MHRKKTPSDHQGLSPLTENSDGTALEGLGGDLLDTGLANNYLDAGLGK